MIARLARTLGLLVAAAAVSTGCVTGERPTLANAAATTGDAAADAVLQRLDRAAGATFTAAYRVDTSRDGVTTSASVSQEGPTRRSVTIGEVQYLSTGDGTSTCTTLGGCADGLDPTRVSDLQVTPTLDAASPAARLRADVPRATGPPVASTETIAGQPAVCVTVPLVPTGTTVCALDSGPLARLVAADVRVELTSFTATVEEAAFVKSG